MFVFERKVIVGPESHTLFEIKRVIHAHEGTRGIVTARTDGFGGRVDQAGGHGLLCREGRISGIHYCVDIGPAMTVTRLTGDSSHLRGILYGYEPTDKAEPRRVTGEASSFA